MQILALCEQFLYQSPESCSQDFFMQLIDSKKDMPTIDEINSVSFGNNEVTTNE